MGVNILNLLRARVYGCLDVWKLQFGAQRVTLSVSQDSRGGSLCHSSWSPTKAQVAGDLWVTRALGRGASIPGAEPPAGDMPGFSTLQGKVKERRERIVLEFEKMNLYLLEEEQRLLQALEREEEETASRLRESVDCLDRQGHSLELLLLQLEERSTHAPLQMLQVSWWAWQARGDVSSDRHGQRGLSLGKRQPTGKGC